MIRASAYVNKPPNNWMTLLATLSETAFFLMSRNGPSVFKIRDESDKMFKVTLGNPHTCNCEEYGANKYCIHIAYCIIKVLRIDKQHPLAYQTCFTDKELDQALSGQYSQTTRQLPAINRGRRSTHNTSNPTMSEVSMNGEGTETINKLEKPSFALPDKIKRKELSTEEENICPICQDDLKEEQSLTWCRHGCGANLHAQCMMKYHQHKSSSGSPTLCPLCRETWDIALLKYVCQSKVIQKGSMANCELLHCHYCKCLIRSRFYRCLECSQKPGYNPSDGSLNHAVDYCSTCYQRIDCVHERHRLHHFMMSDASIEKVRDVTWVPCKGPFANTAHNPVLAALQERELTTNDYDLLLSLDDQFSMASLANYLVSVLPLLSPMRLQQLLQRQHAHHLPSQSTTAVVDGVNTVTPATSRICWCETSAYSDISCVELLCEHTAHSKCIKEDIEVIVRQDISQLLNYRCAHEGCGKIMFRCIQRKKKSMKKKTSVSSNPSLIASDSTTILNSPTQRSNALLPISVGIRSHSAHQPTTSSVNIVVGNGVQSNNRQESSTSPHRLRRYSTESSSTILNEQRPTRETIRQRVLLQRHREELLVNDPTFSSSILNVGVSRLDPGTIDPIVQSSSSVNIDEERNYDLASLSRVSTSNLSKQSVNNRGVVIGPGKLRPMIGRVTPLTTTSQSIQLTPTVTHMNGQVNLGIAITNDANDYHHTGIPPSYTNHRATPNNSHHLRTIRTLKKLDRKLQNLNQQRNSGLQELQERYDQPLQLSVMALHSSRSQNSDDLSLPSNTGSHHSSHERHSNQRAIRRGSAVLNSSTRSVHLPTANAESSDGNGDLQQLLNVNHYLSV